MGSEMEQVNGRGERESWEKHKTGRQKEKVIVVGRTSEMGAA
jgi:hypothetical protein